VRWAERTREHVCEHATDDRLRVECACGRMAAFVEANRPRVIAFLRRQTRDRATADDLCQDCFLIVLARLRQGTLADPSRVRAFLWGTVRRVLYAHRRETCRSLPSLGGMDSMLPSGTSMAPDADNVDLRRVLVSALHRLSEPRDRDLLVRRYLLEQEPAAIQRDLGLTPGTFKVALHRARLRMRTVLKEYGV
jgi:RNA polymerase sigma factor (sigma-70 family)